MVCVPLISHKLRSSSTDCLLSDENCALTSVNPLKIEKVFFRGEMSTPSLDHLLTWKTKAALSWWHHITMEETDRWI